ncbi:MAG: alpha/beta hydrolase [Acidimicrobiia bacterium]|nr:alpha/beta hydrolase [Acidimicrobiia bacterium]
MYRTEIFHHEGHELVYDVYGSGNRLVVYTHGLLLDSNLNRGIAEALARRGNRVVLLDLLGHGRSDRPTHASAYRIDAYANQVFGLLDTLGEADAVLGGLSLGANVSLFAATQHPERVRGLVLEMPVLEWAVPSAALTFVPILLAAHYGRRVLRLTSGALRRVPRTRYGSLNSALNAASLPPEVMAAVLHGVLVGPVAPTIEQRARIAVPSLVLAHRNDLIHPFDDAANLVEQMPAARLVRAHSPLELRRRPDRLTEEISSFLEEVWSAVDLDISQVEATTPIDETPG